MNLLLHKYIVITLFNGFYKINKMLRNGISINFDFIKIGNVYIIDEQIKNK